MKLYRPASFQCATCQRVGRVERRGPVPQYCSKACRKYMWTRGGGNKRSGRWYPPTFQCEICQRVYDRPASTPYVRVCSKRCRKWLYARWPEQRVSWFRPYMDSFSGLEFERECAKCGAEFIGYSHNARFCSSKCRPKKGSRSLSPSLRMAVLERDGWVCHLCGRRIGRTANANSAAGASVDHLVPVSCGGSDDLSNLAAAHRGCNSSRGVGGSVQLKLLS